MTAYAVISLFFSLVTFFPHMTRESRELSINRMLDMKSQSLLVQVQVPRHHIGFWKWGSLTWWSRSAWLWKHQRNKDSSLQDNILHGHILVWRNWFLNAFVTCEHYVTNFFRPLFPLISIISWWYLLWKKNCQSYAIYAFWKVIAIISNVSTLKVNSMFSINMYEK